MGNKNKKVYSVPFSVRLPEKYIRYIAKVTEETGVGRSEYIRKLVLNDFLANKEKLN